MASDGLLPAAGLSMVGPSATFAQIHSSASERRPVGRRINDWEPVITPGLDLDVRAKQQTHELEHQQGPGLGDSC